MNTQHLGFADITRIEPGIFEIVVAPSVEVDIHKAIAMHRFLDEHVDTPSHFLINKKNDYSLSLEAMRNVGNHPAVAGIAFLLFRPSTAKIVEIQRKLMINREIDTGTFWDRNEALDWIRMMRGTTLQSLHA
jgi:hypothetical protein